MRSFLSPFVSTCSVPGASSSKPKPLSSNLKPKPSLPQPPAVFGNLPSVQVHKYGVYTPSHNYGFQCRNHTYSIFGYFGPLGLEPPSRHLHDVFGTGSWQAHGIFWGHQNQGAITWKRPPNCRSSCVFLLLFLYAPCDLLL